MRLLSLLAVLAFLVPAASAQIGRGAQELNGSGTATFYEDGSIVSILLNYGYFVTRSVEVGPSVQLSRVDSDFSDASTYGVLGGFAHFHFGRPGATSVPFVGVEIGAGVGDASGGVFTFVGGGKFFVSRGAALTPAAFLQLDDDGNTAFGARFGVSAFF